MKTVLIIIGGSIPFMLLTVWAVVDAAVREFESPGQKALWVIVAAIPYVGFAVYFLFGRRRGKKPA